MIPAHDPVAVAAVAAARFGLGARPGELDRIGGDARGWLAAQLAGPIPRPRALDGLDSAAARMREFEQALQDRRDVAARKAFRDRVRAQFIDDVGRRFDAAIASDRPFAERLVQFWSNHFTVAINRFGVAGLAVPFETEAIRPHVTGRFVDMLMAVTRHPAMLIYLDNARSIGPHSPVGERRGKGLNENLGRELMELHTLGADSGYTQADVTTMAAILTGWSIAGLRDRRATPGTFLYRANFHEPGPKTLLGRRYSGGEAEGIAALRDLASHPATAHHLATELATHFIADRPPRESVERLARIYLETGGDLRQVSLALVSDQSAWQQAQSKLKSPQDFVLSACRALALDGHGRQVLGSLRLMGQAPFGAPSPAGWPDITAAWLGPEAVMQRIDWSLALADRLRGQQQVDPGTVLHQALGPLASPATLTAVARAPSRPEALALALVSPEFQRR